MTRTVTLLAAALVSTSFSNSANAGYRQIDELAMRVQRQSTKLIYEFQMHFSRAPGYRHLMSDARDLHRLASHIHEVAHYRGRIRHLQSDLRQLDRSFHHLEDLVVDIKRNSHCGQIRGRIGHVRQLMNRMEDNIHRLRDEVRELNSGCNGRYDRHQVRRHPVPDYRQPYRTSQPSFAVRLGSSGFYFDGRNVRFGY